MDKYIITDKAMRRNARDSKYSAVCDELQISYLLINKSIINFVVTCLFSLTNREATWILFGVLCNMMTNSVKKRYDVSQS